MHRCRLKFSCIFVSFKLQIGACYIEFEIDVSREPLKWYVLQRDVPTFEFVDLPGLQTYPAELKEQTTQLVSRYLSEPDTLVLCVVEATTSALDSTNPVEMIRNAGKLSHTILALTKSDLVMTRSEVANRIFKQVLGTSSDMKHLPGLAGCVAVTSRYCRDGQSLQEADRKEHAMFGKMLRDPAEGYGSTEVQEKLKDHLGCSQLINRLDDLYGSFIVNCWKPVALQQLNSFTVHVEQELHNLGPPVDQLTTEAVMQAVFDQVLSSGLCLIAKHLGQYKLLTCVSECDCCCTCFVS